MAYTIKDAWPQLVAYYERLQDYQSSVAQCRMVADYFGPTRRIDAITFADVEEFQNHLLTVVGNKPSTVNAKVAKLRLMRQLAIRNGATNMPPMPANVTAKHVKKALWTADELHILRPDDLEALEGAMDASSRGYFAITIAPRARRRPGQPPPPRARGAAAPASTRPCRAYIRGGLPVVASGSRR